jgi:hypothetical protein
LPLSAQAEEMAPVYSVAVGELVDSIRRVGLDSRMCLKAAFEALEIGIQAVEEEVALENEMLLEY